jgi:metal-responsive CopG/Arc/MetJ family transcriptional regulator
MKKRSAQTYSIDDELYEIFNRIVKEKNINKSRLIESLIKDFVKNNLPQDKKLDS